ncbi:MAG: fimbrillin family protein [Alistipes sp.]
MKQQIFLLATAAVLLTSCSNNEIEVETISNGRIALQVKSGITRASGNQWDDGDQIGIFMTTANTADNRENVGYTTTKGGTSSTFNATEPTNTIYFPVNGDEATFEAYYPYRAALENGKKYNITLNDQSSQRAIDLMVATPVTSTKLNPNVGFVFGHKLSKLDLTIKGDGKVVTDEMLSGMSITLGAFNRLGSYNIKTGELMIATDVGTPPVALPVAADGKHAEAIVLPGTQLSQLTLKLKLVGIENPFTCKLETALNKTTDTGKKYNYTITFNGTEIGLSSTVTDWAPGNGAGDEVVVE